MDSILPSFTEKTDPPVSRGSLEARSSGIVSGWSLSIPGDFGCYRVGLWKIIATISIAELAALHTYLTLLT